MSTYVDVSTLDRTSEHDWLQSLYKRLFYQLNAAGVQFDLPIPHNSTKWREFLSALSSSLEENRRLVIALDEIGALPIPQSDQFFSVLRDVFNSRQAEPFLRRLTFMLTGAFHPRDLIVDEHISPFNVAARVRLADFDIRQTHEFARKTGSVSPASTRATNKAHWSDEIVERIYFWTGGQPYLTQCLFAEWDKMPMETSPTRVDDIVNVLRREDRNHLPHLADSIAKHPSIHAYLLDVLQGKSVPFYPSINSMQAQLELIGIVKSDDKGDMCIRNRIYAQLLRDMQLADHKHRRSQRQDLENVSPGGGSSPQEQLMQARRNLQLIERRKAEYVLGVDIPLQLIKEEQRLRENVRDLESKLDGT